jgi:hypothetical protein
MGSVCLIYNACRVMSTKPSPKKPADGGAPKAVGSKSKTTTAGPRASFAMNVGHDSKSDGKVLKPTQKANSTVKTSKSASADPFALALAPVPNDGSELLAEVPPTGTRVASSLPR